MSRIQWVAEIVGEYGGPVIVADARDYEKWSGTMRRDREAARTLHYWGQFSSELPEPYTVSGGHVHRQAASFEELERDVAALLAAVRKKFPSATVTLDEDAGAAQVRLSDGRQMWIEFRATTHYDAACAVAQGDDYEDLGDAGDDDDDDEEDLDDAYPSAWAHTFQTSRGAEGSAIFWDKQGAGSCHVGLTSERDELVILRTWVDDDRFEETAKAFVDAPTTQERRANDTELTVSSGRVIAAYSPHSWPGILGVERLETLMAEVEAMEDIDAGREKLCEAFRSLHAGDEVVDLNVDGAVVACAMPLRAGTYAVSFGSFDPEDDDDDWSCIWCRLALT